MPETRVCKKCGGSSPLDKSHFGHTPNGGFRWTCRKCMRKKVAAHTKANPDKVAERFKRRRAQELAAGNNYNKESLRLQLRIYQRELCFYCKEKISDIGELDHMLPIARGGLDTLENIALACNKCNKEKHNKSIDEYREWLRKNRYIVKF